MRNLHRRITLSPEVQGSHWIISSPWESQTSSSEPFINSLEASVVPVLDSSGVPPTPDVTVATEITLLVGGLHWDTDSS